MTRGLFDSPDSPLVPPDTPTPTTTPTTTEPTVSLLALTNQQRRAGIAEAVMRASFDMPHMGEDDVVVTANWSRTDGGSLGVFVQGTVAGDTHVQAGVVFAKHYDDLAVLGQIRISRK